MLPLRIFLLQLGHGPVSFLMVAMFKQPCDQGIEMLSEPSYDSDRAPGAIRVSRDKQSTPTRMAPGRRFVW